MHVKAHGSLMLPNNALEGFFSSLKKDIVKEDIVRSYLNAHLDAISS